MARPALAITGASRQSLLDRRKYAARRGERGSRGERRRERRVDFVASLAAFSRTAAIRRVSICKARGLSAVAEASKRTRSISPAATRFDEARRGVDEKLTFSIDATAAAFICASPMTPPGSPAFKRASEFRFVGSAFFCSSSSRARARATAFLAVFQIVDGWLKEGAIVCPPCGELCASSSAVNGEREMCAPDMEPPMFVGDSTPLDEPCDGGRLEISPLTLVVALNFLLATVR